MKFKTFIQKTFTENKYFKTSIRIILWFLFGIIISGVIKSCQTI